MTVPANAPVARALIVDDEPRGRRRLRRLVAEHAGVELLGECTNGLEAVAAIRELEPDIVFLDIRMPDLDGFGVVERVSAAKMPVVVFVTAFDQYAVDAFRHHALDYLLKPFSDDRFGEALERALARLNDKRSQVLYAQLADLIRAHNDRVPAPARAPLSAPQEPDRSQRIAVQKRDQTLLVPVTAVEWIEAQGSYARLHTGEGSHLVRRSLTSLEGQLGDEFVRVHRSTIVRIDQIVSMSSLFHGEVELTLRRGARVKLSRTYRHLLTGRQKPRAPSACQPWMGVWSQAVSLSFQSKVSWKAPVHAAAAWNCGGTASSRRDSQLSQTCDGASMHIQAESP